MAFVFDVITFLIESAVIFCERESTSAKTGTAPAVTIVDADAKKVRGETITSSQGPIPRATIAKSSATVPFATETAWLHPSHAANSSSNLCPLFPVL